MVGVTSSFAFSLFTGKLALLMIGPFPIYLYPLFPNPLITCFESQVEIKLLGYPVTSGHSSLLPNLYLSCPPLSLCFPLANVGLSLPWFDGQETQGSQKDVPGVVR